MITPDELKEKALRIYPKAIEAWLTGETAFFPYSIRCNLAISRDFSTARLETQTLRNGSKSKLGFGYSVDWQTIKSPKVGLQDRACRVFIETFEDLLKWLGKQAEFRRLAASVDKIRERYPVLNEWLVTNWRRLLDVESLSDDLLKVVDYMVLHPRPNCYPRELPLNVSTKLIESHSKILSEWFDQILEYRDIEWGAFEFSRRYGFREPSPHYLVRLLDEQLMPELQCPGPEFSMPLTLIGSLAIRNATVLIVENKINLLTLPQLPRTIAIGGLGYGVSTFFDIPWIATSRLYYWGDLDVDGLRILNRVREQFSHARSLMMDGDTLSQFQSLITPGNAADFATPVHLTESERTAFELCRLHNWRLEQERIPQSHVNDYLTGQRLVAW